MPWLTEAFELDSQSSFCTITFLQIQKQDDNFQASNLNLCDLNLPKMLQKTQVRAAACSLAAAAQLVADEVQHRLFVLSCWCLAYPPYHLTLWPA